MTGPRRTPETKSMAEGDARQHHGRPHVGLGQDQQAGHAGDQQQRPDDPAVGRTLIEPAGDEVGREDRQGQLHQLGRLEPQLPEADPAARALDVHAEPGHQDDEQEQERDDQEERG